VARFKKPKTLLEKGEGKMGEKKRIPYSVKIPIRVERLLREYRKIQDELREKRIVRSGSFTGDIGEFYAALFFNLFLQKEEGYDGIHKTSKKKYEVKTRLTPEEGQFRTTYGAFNPDYRYFDYLICVCLDTDYFPLKIIRIPYKVAQKYVELSKQKRGSSYRIRVTDDLCGEKSVKSYDKQQIKDKIEKRLKKGYFLKGTLPKHKKA
jgi:hypothetical protein